MLSLKVQKFVFIWKNMFLFNIFQKIASYCFSLHKLRQNFTEKTLQFYPKN